MINWLPFQKKHKGKALQNVPYDWILQFENRRLLYEAMQALKPPHREVLIYRKIEELSPEETSVILGCSVTKVANTQRSALKTLEKILGGNKYGFTQSIKRTEQSSRRSCVKSMYLRRYSSKQKG